MEVHSINAGQHATYGFRIVIALYRGWPWEPIIRDEASSTPLIPPAKYIQ